MVVVKKPIILECLFVCSLIQKISNGFYTTSKLLGNRNSAYVTIELNDFHDFIEIFDN